MIRKVTAIIKILWIAGIGIIALRNERVMKTMPIKDKCRILECFKWCDVLILVGLGEFGKGNVWGGGVEV